MKMSYLDHFNFNSVLKKISFLKKNLICLYSYYSDNLVMRFSFSWEWEWFGFCGSEMASKKTVVTDKK